MKPGETRLIVAIRANEISNESRYRGPLICEGSSRVDLTEWLQWCDPNGSHLDRYAIAEGFDPYDLDGAWNAIADMTREEEGE
jgi:hypothetical protein